MYLKLKIKRKKFVHLKFEDTIMGEIEKIENIERVFPLGISQTQGAFLKQIEPKDCK